MKNFIIQIAVFFIFFGLIFLFGIFLPVTPKAKDHMLQYKTQKDSLLINENSPRIIFIGGSNLVFGLNSQMIKDSLGLNPINNGMAASIGLIYMMDDVLPHIKPGDFVVIAAEYDHFFGDLAYGGNDLFRLIMDVEKVGLTKLRLKHWPNVIKAVPNYFISKFTLSNYFYDKKNNVYGKNIFNEYGDSDFHWRLEKRDFHKLNPIKSSFNSGIIKEITAFNQKLNEKDATLLITFSCLQETSMDIIAKNIDKVQQELDKTNLFILGTPQRFGMPDSLMFDTPWHLNKKGVDLRTKLLIEDIKRSESYKSKRV